MSSNMSNKRILIEFIYCFFIPFVTRSDCPTKLNLRTLLKAYLEDKEHNHIKREELASILMPDLIRRLMIKLESWSSLGVPFPFYQSDEKNEIFLTWRHHKYEEITGHPAISANYIAVLEWIQTLNQKTFLMPCALYLRLLGAKKIFITDGPRDGGIDIIAKIEKTPFNSIVFFVQAKTGSQMTRDTILLEYGKYLSLPHEEIYQRYRRALDIDRPGDGASFCYVIFANCEFHNTAKEISSKLGVLLRSKIQIAYFLSQVYTKDDLINSMSLGLDLKADLSLNIAEKLPLSNG